MRVKRGTTSLKTRRNVLKAVKGYRFGRGTKERQAREAIAHAGTYAFNHRRDKKSDFRRLWQVQINSALRFSQSGDKTGDPKESAISYNSFVNILKKQNVSLDRKILASLAENQPQIFDRIVRKL